jgi:hypothetical protein
LHYQYLVKFIFHQLKKLINQIVRELSSLGLNPDVLQELLEYGEGETEKTEEADSTLDDHSSQTKAKIIYEVNTTSGHIEPRLRLWVNSGILSSSDSGSSTPGSTSENRADSPEKLADHDIGGSNISLLWALQRETQTFPCGGSRNAHIPEVSTPE